MIVALVARSGRQRFAAAPSPTIISRRPPAIFVAGRDLLLSGEMLAQTAHTLRSVLIGWAIANIIGIGLGLVLGFSAFARRYILASLEVLRPMPVVAFLPLALLLFNFSLTTELVLIIYASLWPVLINTMGGIMSTPPRLYDVGRTLRLSRARIAAEGRAAGRRARDPGRLPAQHGARTDHRDHRRDAGEPARARLRRHQPAAWPCSRSACSPM